MNRGDGRRRVGPWKQVKGANLKDSELVETLDEAKEIRVSQLMNYKFCCWSSLRGSGLGHVSGARKGHLT
jgi:hypothetical protein